jgi:hypothetical protein
MSTVLGEVAYLASPYTHKSKSIMKRRERAVTHAAAKLTEQGYTLICPITTSAQLVQFMENTSSVWADWEKNDKRLVKVSDFVIVLCLDGWDKSVGVTAEIEYAKALNKSIMYISPESLNIKDVV